MCTKENEPASSQFPGVVLTARRAGDRRPTNAEVIRQPLGRGRSRRRTCPRGRPVALPVEAPAAADAHAQARAWHTHKHAHARSECLRDVRSERWVPRVSGRVVQMRAGDKEKGN
eukprot:6199760-Pleurochrysis_carterae.AAC.1